jgi:hypothetical protein
MMGKLQKVFQNREDSVRDLFWECDRGGANGVKLTLISSNAVEQYSSRSISSMILRAADTSYPGIYSAPLRRA